MQAQRINFLENEIEGDPMEPFNYYALALEYVQIDTNKAQNLFEKILDVFPEYLPVYYKSAEFFEEIGDNSKANQIFKKGITLAEKLENQKAIKELKSRYQLFLDENEY